MSQMRFGEIRRDSFTIAMCMDPDEQTPPTPTAVMVSSFLLMQRKSTFELTVSATRPVTVQDDSE